MYLQWDRFPFSLYIFFISRIITDESSNLSPPVGYCRNCLIYFFKLYLYHPKISFDSSFSLLESELISNSFLSLFSTQEIQSYPIYFRQPKAKHQQRRNNSKHIYCLHDGWRCAHIRTGKRLGYTEPNESTRTLVSLVTLWAAIRGNANQLWF